MDVSARRYRYVGLERDSETGLYSMGARYYATWLGRWTSADPLGVGADGPGVYNYTRGSPIVLTDPGGMQGGAPNLGDSIAALNASLSPTMRSATAKELLHRWRVQFESEVSSSAPERSQGEREEVEQLRRRLRDLEAENSLLKKAAALFAKDVK